MPHNNSNWLIASIMECMASETMAELPLMAAPINLVAAIIISTARAIYITVFDFTK